jgi:hypothetical protein
MTAFVDLVSPIVWTFPLAFGYNVLKVVYTNCN